MWVFAILRVENIKIKIQNTLRIFLISALFSPNIGNEMMWVFGFLRAKTIRIKIKNIYSLFD
jgi:hypothetical protein